MANCPYCKKYFPKKDLVVDHMYKMHSVELDRDHMDAPQALYYSTHGTLKGQCMCGCGRETEWNPKTGKPFKVSSNPECRKRLREAALKNHVKVYGKETLLNDMEHQKEMQKHRPTAGKYQFKDGGYVDYLSKPEKNFLQFCDKIMDLSSNMIQSSPETFTYYDPVTKTNRQYDPDYYLPDYNLIVEIKDGGSHTNTNPAFVKETKYKVALKDEVMRKQTKYNYIKIVDQSYGPFVELLYKIVSEDYDTDPKNKAHKYTVITEAACKDAEDVDLSVEKEEMKGTAYLVVGRMKGTNMVKFVGLSESSGFERIYLTDFITTTLRETDRDDPVFADTEVTVYKYCGDKEPMKEFFSMVIRLALSNQKDIIWNIIDLMSKFGIFYADHKGLENNKNKKMDFIKKGGDR